MKTLLLSSMVALLASFPALAEIPLKLELLAPKEPVTLNKNDLEKPGRGGAAPRVGINLSYRITNTGKKDITFNHGRDDTTNLLVIKGPGAIEVPYNGPMTADYRMGAPLTIKPGESKEFEIVGLKYGTRDMSYWSINKAGDYEVSMTYRTRIGGEGFFLKSNAAKFSVVVK